MRQATNKKIGITVACVSIFYLILSYQLPKYNLAIVDADVVPKILGWLLLFLSVLLFIRKDEETAEQKQKRDIPKREIKVLLSVAGFIFLYIFLLEILGFVLVTILFVFFCSKFLGFDKLKTNLAVSFLFPICMYAVFVYLLQISLPKGILPF